MRQILRVFTQTQHIAAQHSTSRHTPTGKRLAIFVYHRESAATPAMALVQINPLGAAAEELVRLSAASLP